MERVSPPSSRQYCTPKRMGISQKHAGLILILILILRSLLRILHFNNLKIQLHVLAKLKTP